MRCEPGGPPGDFVVAPPNPVTPTGRGSDAQFALNPTPTGNQREGRPLSADHQPDCPRTPTGHPPMAPAMERRPCRRPHRARPLRSGGIPYQLVRQPQFRLTAAPDRARPRARAVSFAAPSVSTTVASCGVAAYFGLTSRRWQSGSSIDVQGRISKAGDADVRRALCEAASGLMTRDSRAGTRSRAGAGRSPNAPTTARPVSLWRASWR